MSGVGDALALAGAMTWEILWAHHEKVALKVMPKSLRLIVEMPSKPIRVLPYVSTALPV